MINIYTSISPEAVRIAKEQASIEPNYNTSKRLTKVITQQSKTRNTTKVMQITKKSSFRSSSIEPTSTKVIFFPQFNQNPQKPFQASNSQEYDQFKSTQAQHFSNIRQDFNMNGKLLATNIIGLKKPARNHYSKISRRKQVLLKRNSDASSSCGALESNFNGQSLLRSIPSQYLKSKDHNMNRISQFQNNSKVSPKLFQISEAYLIEKYRELSKDRNNFVPFNAVNKLYKVEVLSFKQIRVDQQQFQVKKLSTIQQFIESKNRSNPIKLKNFESNVEKIIEKKSEGQPIKQIWSSAEDVNLRSSNNLNAQSPSKEIIKQQSVTNNIKWKKSYQFKTLANDNRQKVSMKNVKNQVKQQRLTIPPPKKVTATSYIIYETNASVGNRQSSKRQIGETHIGLNIKLSAEIASLTKIMTCIAVIEICQKLKINPETQNFKIGISQCSVGGTSAELQPGQIYSIHQLLYGLMLPSGNDASIALARWAGNILLINEANKKHDKSKEEKRATEANVEWWAANNVGLKSKDEYLKSKRCINRFLAQMNKTARVLGMTRTNYTNPHGLSNPHNKSCCFDLALLCQHSMKNSYFRKIVSTKYIEFTIQKQPVCIKSKFTNKNKRAISFEQDPELLNMGDDLEQQISDCQSTESEISGQRTSRLVKWMNTHQLLQSKQQYIGVKTGVTTTAGPCLISFIVQGRRQYIIIVLNSKKLSLRFQDTQILKGWLFRKQKNE